MNKLKIFCTLLLLAFALSASGQTRPDWLDIKNRAPKDVKQFGAKGNGSADDTVAIQAAIDSACARPPQGSNMQYLIIIKQFVSENQLLLTTALLIASYFLKRFIDAKAANPAQDIWDSIKPGSDALYVLAHRGVEYLGKSKGMDKAAKLLEYLKVIEQFERDWQADRIAAVKRLAAWYLSMQGKQVAANPSTLPVVFDPDAPAVEPDESSKT